MDRDAAVAIIKDRLKRGASTTIDADIVTEMQFVQENILEGNPWLPWFLLSEFISVDTIADENRIAVPADVSFTGNDFLREYEEGALWRVDASVGSGKVLLEKDFYDALDGAYSSTGKPVKYSLDGEYFRLFPTPDGVYTLKTRAYLRAAVLSTNVENSWLKYASDWLISETAAIIAGEYLRDDKAEARQQANATRARNRLMVVDEARKQANLEPNMGDKP